MKIPSLDKILYALKHRQKRESVIRTKTTRAEEDTLRVTHTHMGGGGFDTSQVWTSYGGWFADPKHWRRNTAVGFGIVFVASAYVFNASRKLEKRPIYPHHRIPSQSWAPEGTFAKK